MMLSHPVTELIMARYSCRSYQRVPLPDGARADLEAFLRGLTRGPFGTPLRLMLVSAASGSDELRGLGTYGVIRHPAGFIIGVVQKGAMDMEDIGYALEQCVLKATDLGLGTCWLGGTFRRSNFAARAAVRQDETLAAVIAVGVIADRTSLIDRAFRRGAGSKHRLPWEQLFFDGQFGAVLVPEETGGYAQVLEMARKAPSASNKQPWRVVLQRTPGYGRSTGLAGIPDIQRVDVGIFMCHFELVAAELGLKGKWQILGVDHVPQAAGAEYRVSWID
jgi:hypothetical protein